MIPKIPVILVVLPHAQDLPRPVYGTVESAGVDLMSAIDQPLILNPQERCLVPTGLIIELPIGYEGQIRSRSGLSLNHGVVVLNAPGTIDSDYRGEIKVLLINHGSVPFIIERGMKIAQFVLASLRHIEWHERETISSETNRGDQGFGSTGLKLKTRILQEPLKEVSGDL